MNSYYRILRLSGNDRTDYILSDDVTVSYVEDGHDQDGEGSVDSPEDNECPTDFLDVSGMSPAIISKIHRR